MNLVLLLVLVAERRRVTVAAVAGEEEGEGEGLICGCWKKFKEEEDKKVRSWCMERKRVTDGQQTVGDRQWVCMRGKEKKRKKVFSKIPKFILNIRAYLMDFIQTQLDFNSALKFCV